MKRKRKKEGMIVNLVVAFALEEKKCPLREDRPCQMSVHRNHLCRPLPDQRIEIPERARGDNGQRRGQTDRA